MSVSSSKPTGYIRPGFWCFLVVLLAALSISDVPAPDDPRATTGEWETLTNLMTEPNGTTPFSAAHAAMLHTGRVLFLPEGEQTLKTLLWDPTVSGSGSFSFPDNVPTDELFCGGHSFLSDGQLLVAGGSGDFFEIANNSAWRFNPDAGTNGTWMKTMGNMLQKRWYPTDVALGEPGFTLVVSGIFGSGDQNANEMEVYDEATDTFIVVAGGTRVFKETYPGLHLLPTGKVLFTRTGWGHDEDEPGQTAAYFTFDNLENPVSGQWTTMASPMNYPDRTEGMSVQILTPASIPEEYTARVVVFGGGFPNTAGQSKVEAISTASLTTNTTWDLLPSMAVPRLHASVVLLPDGNALVFGGEFGSGGTKATEIFNSVTETFTQADNMEVLRGYHTVTLLLPSGKVMATGGTIGDDERKIEIFSPPYLFKGPRPTITSVPGLFKHSQSFTITTPDAASIQKVVLVRPMAHTHHTDSEQRVLPLVFNQVDSQTLAVTAPGHHPYPQAPPGYYMLFILNSNGVPSQGEFVHLQADLDDDDDGDPDTTDCARLDPAVHHGANEVCNGIDDNCVNGVDEGFPDLDGDGIKDCVDPNFDALSQVQPSEGSIVSGIYTDLRANSPNNSYEVLSEQTTGNKRKLTKIWTFNVVAGEPYDLRVEAFKVAGGQSSVDDFHFSIIAKAAGSPPCSASDNFGSTVLTVVNSTDDDLVQSAALGTLANSMVCVRVQDSNRGTDSQADLINIDRLFLYQIPCIDSPGIGQVSRCSSGDGSIGPGTMFSGTFINTRAADGQYEVMQESVQAGRSRLAKTWMFQNVPAGTHTLHIEGYHLPSGDGDDFQFYFGTSASGPFTLINSSVITQTTPDQIIDSASFGAGLSGNFYIQVKDTLPDNSIGLDLIYVDHLVIRTTP